MVVGERRMNKKNKNKNEGKNFKKEERWVDNKSGVDFHILQVFTILT